MNRRLLLIAYYFPPWGMGGVQRPLKLAKYLPELGWDVTVIAPEPGPYHAHDASLVDELPDNVSIARVPAGLSNRMKKSVQGDGTVSTAFQLLPLLARGVQQWLRWPDDKRGFAKRAHRRALQLVKDTPFDVVLTTSPPPSIHLAGMSISRALHVPWIADFRDPWLVRRDDWGPSLFHILYNRRLRRRMLRTADAVIATSDTTANELARDRRDVIHTILNGFDEDDFAETGGSGNDEPATIAFYGTMSPSIGIEQVFGVLGAFHDRYPEIKFRIRHIGTAAGVDPATLAHVCGLSDMFETTGYLPHRAAIRELMTADVVVLSMAREPDFEGTIPGRTFEVLRSLKPILLCAPRSGALARLLDSQHGIWQFNPGDVRSGLAAVQRILSSVRGHPLRTVESLTAFDRQGQARQVASILSDAATTARQVDVTA